MTKAELYDKIHTILNNISDLKEELNTVVRGLRHLESEIEALPSQDEPLEDEDPK